MAQFDPRELPPMPYRVLFLGRFNATRSIFAEAILERLSEGRFMVASAGSTPCADVDPLAHALLARRGHDLTHLACKAPNIAQEQLGDVDVVISLCPLAQGQAQAIWGSQPIHTHWAVQDPSTCRACPADLIVAYAEAYRTLYNRIEALVSLNWQRLSRVELTMHLRAIGGISSAEVDKSVAA